MNVGMWVGVGVIALGVIGALHFGRKAPDAGAMSLIKFFLCCVVGVVGLFILTLSAAFAYPVSRSPFPSCPAQGDTHELRVQKLNYLKNRASPPTHIDPQITLKAVLTGGNDVHRWSDNAGATIRGWVILVKPGGYESVNCHSHALVHRDTHIELALTPTASNTQAMVVEVTPYWRNQKARMGVNWSTHHLERLKGHLVQITGWMFWDAEHANAAVHTAPTNPHDWRATAWEIHPITGIKVIR